MGPNRRPAPRADQQVLVWSTISAAGRIWRHFQASGTHCGETKYLVAVFCAVWFVFVFLHVPVSHSRLERSARCERLSARRRSYGRPRTARPPSAALHSDNWRSKALRRAPAILPQLVLADAVAASAAFIGACSRVSRSLPNSYCRKSKKKKN